MDLIQTISWNIIGIIAISLLFPLYLLQLCKDNNWKLPTSSWEGIEEDPLGKKRLVWMGYISFSILSLFYLDSLFQWVWIGGIGLSTSITLSYIRKEWVDYSILCSLFWIMMNISVHQSNPYWITGWAVVLILLSYNDSDMIWVEISWWIFMMLLLWG